ncbi:MAG: GyrI-like domain-containing protein [Candidatus Thorarchaeota archaeon]
MDKIDHKKVFKEFYKPPKKPTTVDVPQFNFIMVDGKGNPNTAQEYADAIGALYGVAYTLKFAMKKTGSVDFTVMPLEGLWWLEGASELDESRKDDWSWTAMIMQPEQVTKSSVDDAIVQVHEKKNLPSLPKLRFEEYHEGRSVQIMYIGPYSDEAPTIELLHEYAENEGFKLRGKHHEIYLGDPRRTHASKAHGGVQSRGMIEARDLIISIVLLLSFLQLSQTSCLKTSVSLSCIAKVSSAVSGRARSVQFFKSQIFFFTNASTKTDNCSTEKSISLTFVALPSSGLPTVVPLRILRCSIFSDVMRILRRV